MTSIPFFCDLPEAAIKPAQELWDFVDTDGYRSLQAYQDFVRKLEVLGIQPPTRSMVNRWTAGVECGLILRPVTGENKLRPQRAPSAEVAETVATEVAPAPSVPPSVPPTAEEKRRNGTLKLPKMKAQPEPEPSKEPIPEPLQELVREIAESPAPVNPDGSPVEFVLPDLKGRFIRTGEAQAADATESSGDAPLPESENTEIPEASSETHSTSTDPVQDAVDIIIKHYQEQEFAKARVEAARKAAAALREFADRIEAAA